MSQTQAEFVLLAILTLAAVGALSLFLRFVCWALRAARARLVARRWKARLAVREAMDPLSLPIVPRDPPAAASTAPRTIHPARLVRLIFKSHAVFPQGVTVWQGSSAELLELLTGPQSLLGDERLELPAAGSLDHRLRGMMVERGHYLRIDSGFESTAAAPVWRLSLNPETARR
jgi:hypothetical protein